MASTPPSASKQRKPTGIGKIAGVIFVASAGAGAAHLTVSEIFPMDTRAMAIAFLYATGTIVGGFGGPRSSKWCETRVTAKTKTRS